MSFIGKDGRAAPTLKNVIYSQEMLEDVWTQTVELIVKLYKDWWVFGVHLISISVFYSIFLFSKVI